MLLFEKLRLTFRRASDVGVAKAANTASPFSHNEVDEDDEEEEVDSDDEKK